MTSTSDGINEGINLLYKKPFDCELPLVTKQALNSFENQEFILHSGNLIVVHDQTVHEHFCLGEKIPFIMHFIFKILNNTKKKNNSQHLVNIF